MQTRHQSAGYLPLSASKANTAPKAPPTLVVRRHACLSFWTTTTTARGRWVSSNPFDVPLESYGAGWHTGYAAILEMTVALRSGALHPSAASAVLAEAFAAVNEQPLGDPASRRGAACAFISVVNSLFTSAALAIDFEAHIQERLAESERCKEALAAHAAQAKTATVERMRLARAAKSAKAAQRNEGGAS